MTVTRRKCYEYGADQKPHLSGYQTASLHCDPKLEKTFASECAGFDNPWLVSCFRVFRLSCSD